MNARCPHCQTLYRLDPARVPAGGTLARCARCRQTFRVGPAAAPTSPMREPGEGPRDGTMMARPDAPPASAAPPPFGPASPPSRSRFAATSPDDRARRLARALVSDIIAYHEERWNRSLEAGTLKADFREEILKSWEEYVAQVGSAMAHGTPHFRNALNEILARGQQVF